MRWHHYNKGITLFLRLRLLGCSKDPRTWLASCMGFDDGLAMMHFTFHSDPSDLTSSLQPRSHGPGQVIVAMKNVDLCDMHSKYTLMFLQRSMSFLISSCLVYETDSDDNIISVASANGGRVSTGTSTVLLPISLLCMLVELTCSPQLYGRSSISCSIRDVRFCLKAPSVPSSHCEVRCTCWSTNTGMSFVHLFAFAH